MSISYSFFLWKTNKHIRHFNPNKLVGFFSFLFYDLPVLNSPVHSVSGSRPCRSVSAASSAGYTSPCALCWVRPSCSTSTPHRTSSNRFWKNIRMYTLYLNKSLNQHHADVPAAVLVFAAVTHGGGLSGRPSDLSFRCLSALVRVDFTISSWVIFNSGCCWMYSRIVSLNMANKNTVNSCLKKKKEGRYVIIALQNSTTTSLVLPRTTSSAPETCRSISVSSCQTAASTACQDCL